jgi:hypothetical protein
LNAIQALSQLSYTPGTFPDGWDIARQEPRRISKGSIDVKKIAMAKMPTAGILQRFYSQNFSISKKRFCCRVFGLSNQQSSARICRPEKAAFA